MYKHFTIEQKLAAEELTSRDASGTVPLYRGGIFYVAYQGSAVLFQRYLKGNLKMLRVVRKSGFCYIKAGVPLGSKCLKGLIEVDAEGQWPASAELSVEAGLGTDFHLGSVAVDKVIERSVAADRSAGTGELILNELRLIDSLALTPLMALSLVNEWRNRLLNGDKERLG